MPTIIGILTFMSRKNSIIGILQKKKKKKRKEKKEFLDIFIPMSMKVEYEKRFITSGPGVKTENKFTHQLQ